MDVLRARERVGQKVEQKRGRGRESGAGKRREEKLGATVWSEGELAAEAKAIKKVHGKKDRRFGDWESTRSVLMHCNEQDNLE